jgi:hypothetical protein
MALEKLSVRLQADGYHTMVFFALNKEPADALVATFRITGYPLHSRSR